MRSAGNGCLILWVGGAMLAALVAGLGGRALPSEAEGNEPIVVKEQGKGLSSSESEAEPGYGPQAIVLERASDGHFYADAQVNGQTIRMLVDTGATAIALARDDARRAGVGISIGMPTVVGQGASGDVHGEVVSLDHVTLGEAEAEDLHAVVLDDGQISLLGQSFLSRFESVEIKGDRMVLR